MVSSRWGDWKPLLDKYTTSAPLAKSVDLFGIRPYNIAGLEQQDKRFLVHFEDIETSEACPKRRHRRCGREPTLADRKLSARSSPRRRRPPPSPGACARARSRSWSGTTRYRHRWIAQREWAWCAVRRVS